MKVLPIPLILVLILVQLPFGPSPQEEKPAVEMSPVKGWWFVTYAAVPSTRYSKAKGIIRAESLGSRSSLFKEVGEKDGIILSSPGTGRCRTWSALRLKREKTGMMRLPG